jgi:cytochrome c2
VRRFALRLGAAVLGLCAATAAAGGDLPPGPNRDLVAGVCGACHDSQYLSESAGLGRAEWSSVLDGMRQFGLNLAPGERQKILDYLATYLGPHPPPAAAAAAAAAGPQPIAALLAKADAQEGRKLSAACAVCHSLAKGGPNKVGPNLFGIVGSPIAEDRNGFGFTRALKRHAGVWTVEKLNQWLYDPQKFAPGTAMSFPGLKEAQQRADVIAYLQSLR